MLKVRSIVLHCSYGNEWKRTKRWHCATVLERFSGWRKQLHWAKLLDWTYKSFGTPLNHSVPQQFQCTWWSYARTYNHLLALSTMKQHPHCLRSVLGRYHTKIFSIMRSGERISEVTCNNTHYLFSVQHIHTVMKGIGSGFRTRACLPTDSSRICLQHWRSLESLVTTLYLISVQHIPTILLN